MAIVFILMLRQDFLNSTQSSTMARGVSLLLADRAIRWGDTWKSVGRTKGLPCEASICVTMNIIHITFVSFFSSLMRVLPCLKAALCVDTTLYPITACSGRPCLALKKASEYRNKSSAKLGYICPKVKT